MEVIMAKKDFWLGMVGVVLTFGLAVVGCASAPAAGKTQAGAAVLGGKTTVVLPVMLAERVKAKDTDSSITGLLRAAQNASTISSYVKAVDEVAERNNADITAKIETAYSSFIEAYNAAFNTTLNKTNFDFGKKTPAINYFVKPDKDAVAQITQLCTDNNAEYVVTILYQFVDGPVVSTMTISDTTYLNAYVVVLDKTGKVVSTNYANTGAAPFRFGYMNGQIKDEEFLSAQYDLIFQLYDALQDVLPGLAAGL
jgi:hypothetical protein